MRRGTRGYAEHADALIGPYESIGFADKHREALPFLPATPSRALDIGAGTGSDAHWLASQGHRVVAVEPTGAFRAYASGRYTSPRIEWVDDGLPGLDSIVRRRLAFDLVLLSAVWMHLDAPERAIAMPVLASLLAPGGVMILSLRHGPVPAGRVMFEVPPAETVAAAKACGLAVLLEARSASLLEANRQAGVTWTKLAFRRPGERRD